MSNSAVQWGDPLKLGEKIGRRIRELREELSMSQADLATKVGWNAHQTVSQIESGERQLKASELVPLAEALGVSVKDLLPREESEKRLRLFWRCGPSVGRAAIEEWFRDRCKEYRFVEKSCGLESLPEIGQAQFDLSADNQTCFARVNELAYSCRSELGLGARPAASLETVLEEHLMVKLVFKDLGGGASGASTVDDELGPAILISKWEAPWRRNFSFGHELFHLMTWQSTRHALDASDSGQLDRLEKFANFFAATLLLPAESVTPEFRKRLKNGKTTYAEAIDLARGFEVSTEALLWRLCYLNLLNSSEVRRVLADQGFREMDRETMPERWRTRDLSPRFVRLAFRAFLKGALSRSALAEYLQTNLAELDGILEKYGLSEDGFGNDDVRANSGRSEEDDWMAYGFDKAATEGGVDDDCTT